MPQVYFPRDSHPAVQRAALRLAGSGDELRNDDPAAADIVVGTARSLQLPEFAARSFRIWQQGQQLWIAGDRPRSVLAGALYWKHHHARGTLPPLPLLRQSPYEQRLILEDFPFHCYAPTGFTFDREAYAENLVALGFTAMECNRFSARQPLEPYYANYLFTNPSVAPFVWTRWHAGVWDEEVVRANAAELRACVQTALDHDLDPSITSFLPRPFPEKFFQVHPHLRGPLFRHVYLERGDHPGVHCVDTDHDEGMAFYADVYRELLRANPEIRHFFFWHADLGTKFWPDGEGSLGCSLAKRIGTFHRHFRGVLDAAGASAQVWINPWQMKEDSLAELNAELPEDVGFSVKDNAGITHFCGTSRMRLKDLNIFSAALGEVPTRIQSLAQSARRPVCLGQYLDFSEDLDPVFGVPHPLMTFRKLHTLAAFNSEASSTNWGILSPDVCRSRVNQDVIRELTWGAQATCFVELLPLLLPAALSTSVRDSIYTAWRKIDLALQSWPQFWGLRFQDSGLRLRWLVKPLLLPSTPIPEADKAYYLDHQIYRIDAPNPFKDFMDITAPQAREVAACYADMIELLRAAEELIEQARRDTKADRECDDWLAAQVPPVRTIRLFFTTYRNVLEFHSLPGDGGLTHQHRALIEAEIANTYEILRFMNEIKTCLIIAERGKWGQCFGPDIAEDFRRKKTILETVLAGSRPHS
jgi:hypothetical protein